MTPRCVVCRTELPADPVLCPRCETPHHQDCWEYTGGCAIYGCAANRVPPPSRPLPVVWQPGERWQGAVFGALLGYAVTALVFAVVLREHAAAVPGLMAGAAAAITGAFAGAYVRSGDDLGSIVLWGTAGPGFSAWLLLIASASVARGPGPDLPTALVLFAVMLIAGVLLCPVALPCAYLVGRFNDPRLKSAARQRRWAGVALAVSLLVTKVLLDRLY